MERKHLTDDEIQNLLDGILPDEASTQRSHLERCEFCQDHLKFYRNLYMGLKAEPGFKLPKNFAETILSKLSPQQATPFAFPVTEIIFIGAGVLLALGATFYFADLKPLAEALGRITLPKLGFNIAVLRPLKQLFSGLNGSFTLLPFAGLSLLSVAILDRIIHKLKQHKLSH
ncbi:MAG: hypothetical protein ABIL68_12525 [bacterium]